jgi:LCP family protein required for cell wall assembly
VVTAIDGFRLWRGIERVDVKLAGAGGGARNFLLVGSDSRSFVRSGADAASFGEDANGAQHADMMMVVHVPATGPPVVLGVPRDLVVDFAATGQHRLTMALGQGPQVLVDAFCTSLGLGLDHLVMLDFEGFRNLIDLVGGVDIDVARPTRDTHTGLRIEAPGTQHLDGAQALSLARSRHAEELVDGAWRATPEGSKDRAERGQKLLTALAPALQERSGSWWGLHQLLSAVSGSVTVDVGAGRSDASELAAALRSASERRERGGMQQLPATIIEGPVPVAHLESRAAGVLHDLGAGANPACPVPAAIVSGLPSEPANPPPTAGGPTSEPMSPPATVRPNG